MMCLICKSIKIIYIRIACREVFIFIFMSFFKSCVPTGYCGGTFCAKNAVCLWDNVQSVQYCSCPDGFAGDGLTSCKSIPPPCNVKNNCGMNAQCVPTANDTYECACNPGYYGDGAVCILEINCANTPSLCHEQGRCISTKSGYQCVCNAGNSVIST